jgi:putative spermidine/putrescine transport system substrate-binding protein
MLDEGPWMQGKQAGLWEKLPEATIPNLNQIPARFKDQDSMGSAYVLYLLGLLYDEEAFKKNKLPKPASYYDLWNPAYKGKVTIPSSSSTFAYALLFQLNRLEGGDSAKSVDPGFAKLKTLVPNIGIFHGGASTLIPLFSQKQAMVAWNASFPAQQLAASGVPVGWVAPKEGAMIVAAYTAIAKNAPNMEAARQFVNLVLSPEYQKMQAEIAFGGPVNPNTKLDAQFAKSFPITKDVIDKAHLMPWDIYNAKRLDLNARFQREIETK